MSKRPRLYATLAAIIAAIGYGGPDLIERIEGLDLPLWLSIVVRVFSYVVAICANGRAVALVGLLFRIPVPTRWRRRKLEPWQE